MRALLASLGTEHSLKQPALQFKDFLTQFLRPERSADGSCRAQKRPPDGFSMHGAKQIRGMIAIAAQQP